MLETTELEYVLIHYVEHTELTLRLKFVVYQVPFKV